MNDLSLKVTVIVPVYNIKDYLPATLDSIRGQTYRNLEIILVDDGSSDSSAELCDQACQNDARFRVFHCKNAGVSASRNLALDHTSGDYCVFIDADDLVKENYIEVMVRIALEKNNSLVVCDSMHGQYHSREMFSSYQASSHPAFREIPIQDFRYTNQYSHDTVWGVLCRTELIGNLRFDLDLFVGEDTVFFSRLLRRARGLVYVEDQYYYYTYRLNSLAHAQYSRRLYTEVLAWERVCAEAEGEDPAFVNECYVALAICCRKNYERAIRAEYPDQDLLRSLVRRTSEIRRYVYHSQERTTAEKIKYAVFLLIPHLFTVIKTHAKDNI